MYDIIYQNTRETKYLGQNLQHFHINIFNVLITTE